MGVAAAKRRRSANKSQRRKAAADRFQAEQARARTWISQFDQDNSNALDRDEFKKLMTYMNDGNEPSEEEVTKIFRKSDIRKTGDLDIDEVVVAVAKWKSMMTEQEFFTNLFNK
jgi:Ca2+-binding EF-hand superfamily protein